MRNTQKDSSTAVSEEILEKVCHSSSHPWSRKLLERVRAEYLGQKSTHQIGSELNMSKDSVRRALRIMGVPIRTSGPIPTLSPEQKAQVTSLLKTTPRRRIAKMFGVGRYAIQQVSAQETRNAQN